MGSESLINEARGVVLGAVQAEDEYDEHRADVDEPAENDVLPIDDLPERDVALVNQVHVDPVCW